MRLREIGCALLATALSASEVSSSELQETSLETCEQEISRLRQALLQIRTETSSGTGVCVSIKNPDGIQEGTFLFTALHVVENARDIFAPDGTLLSITEANPKNDIALLRSDSSDSPPCSHFFPLKMTPLSSQEHVFLGGYPYGGDLEIHPGQYNADKNTVSGGTYPGMSGGAVLSCEENTPVFSGVLIGYQGVKEKDKIIPLHNRGVFTPILEIISLVKGYYRTKLTELMLQNRK